MNLEKLFSMQRVSVIQIINPYKKTNTYIVEVNNFEVVIIDLGNYPILELIRFLKNNNKTLIGLFLTHEHSDHCYGVDFLKAELEFTLYCSRNCEINMRNPKQNFSRYIEELEVFGVQAEATVVSDGQVLSFGDIQIKIIETPGHSPGSICLLINEMIFTGDTFLNNERTPSCFPHSSKKDLKKSEKKILKYLTRNTTIFPGHGDSFKIKV